MIACAKFTKLGLYSFRSKSAGEVCWTMDGKICRNKIIIINNNNDTYMSNALKPCIISTKLKVLYIKMAIVENST